MAYEHRSRGIMFRKSHCSSPGALIDHSGSCSHLQAPAEEGADGAEGEAVDELQLQLIQVAFM